MSSLRLFTDPPPVIVADASGVINLNATGRAAEIIRLLPHRFVVTDNACIELEDGMKFGHNDSAQLQQLISLGLVFRESLVEEGLAIYETLISGSTASTLDDGEAATIGHAVQFSAIALIDERKAARICGGSYPGLSLLTTAELLLHPLLAIGLKPEPHRQAILGALRDGRMRVPPEFLGRIRDFIGAEAAAACPSLPRSLHRR